MARKKNTPILETVISSVTAGLSPVANRADLQKSQPIPAILGQSFISAAQNGTFLQESNATDSSYYTRTYDWWSVGGGQLNYSKYNNLINRSIPYVNSNGYWNMRDCIILCQTAWREVPVFYRTVEDMTTLANTELKLVGGSDDAKKFFKVWFDKINIFNLKDQCFRELLRSGNLFIYRYDGGIKSNKINKFILSSEALETEAAELTEEQKISEAARTINIPVKYVILNPAEMCLSTGGNGEDLTPSYYRMIDLQTKEKLRGIQKEGQINLEKELKDLINNNYSVDNTLKTENLYSIFYHKQDYEPFALPMGFPVLEDINLKLEMKKADACALKTVESMITLITHGATDKDGNTVMNPLVDAALKDIFKNVSTGGRHLISDCTTKIDFLIPDLKKVIGPEKYLKLDSDINDGLFNILFGEQKFANIMVKLRVFVKILEHLQDIFLNEFFRNEVSRVGKLVGYSDEEIPEVKFAKINLEDQSQAARTIAQLATLGLLTPEETFDAMENGLLPIKEDSEKNQASYRKLRDKQLYLPLVGASDPSMQPEIPAGITSPTKKVGSTKQSGRPGGTTGIKQKTQNIAPKGTTASEKYSFDPEKFRSDLLLANSITNDMNKIYSKRVGRTLTDDDTKYLEVIATHLITNETPENWKKNIKQYLKELPIPNFEKVSLAEEIKNQNDTNDFTSALLTHSVIV